jgi:ribosomal-protein-alanine N-acetyltransferase
MHLEPIGERHAAILFEGLSDAACYQYIPHDPPACLEALVEQYRKLESRRSSDGHQAWLNWALCGRDGVAHGYVQSTIDLQSRQAWIAYFVFTRSQSHGYAREAFQTLLPRLREVYGVIQFRAEIDTRNRASIRLIESLGFKRERLVRAADEFKGAVSDEYHYVTGEQC